MGEKQNKNEGEKENKKGEGGKKEEDKNPPTVVLKVDMHCEGCASKVVRCVQGFQGVETVKPEWAASKITVTGKVDPTKLRDRLQQKTKKKVELVSPQPKKDKDPKENKDNSQKKPDNSKPKEAPVTTAVLKMSLHCKGCMEKIHRTISKTKGVHELAIDEPKNLVTVKGTMDIKALTENLKEKIRRPVDIVPPKKEKEGGESNTGGGGGGGGNGNGGGKKGKKGGGGGGAAVIPAEEGGDGARGAVAVSVDGGGAGGGGGGGGGEEIGGGGGRMEGNKMQYVGQFGYGYYGYGPAGFVELPHPPQMFSDENPNACSIM